MCQFQGKTIYTQSQYQTQKLLPTNPAFYINSPYDMPLKLPFPQLLINPFKPQRIRALTPAQSKLYDDAIKQSAYYTYYEQNVLKKVVYLYAEMLYNQIETYKQAYQTIYDAIDQLEEGKQQYLELVLNTFSKMKDSIFIDLNEKQDILLDDNTTSFIDREHAGYYALQFTNIYSQKFINKKIKRNYIKVVLPDKTCMYIQPEGRTLPTYDSVVLLCEYLERYAQKEDEDQQVPPSETSNEIQEEQVQIQEDVLADRDDEGVCSVCNCNFDSYNEHILSEQHQRQYAICLTNKVGRGIKAVSCNTYLKMNIPKTNKKCYSINQQELLNRILRNNCLLLQNQQQIDNKCVNKYKQLQQYKDFIQEVKDQESQIIEKQCNNLLNNQQFIDQQSTILSSILLNKKQYLFNELIDKQDATFVYIEYYTLQQIKNYDQYELQHIFSFINNVQKYFTQNQQYNKILFIKAIDLEKELQQYQLTQIPKENLIKLGFFTKICLEKLNIKIQQQNDIQQRVIIPHKVIKQQYVQKLSQIVDQMQKSKLKFQIKINNVIQKTIKQQQINIEQQEQFIPIQTKNILEDALYAGIYSINSQSQLDFIQATQYYLQQYCSDQLNSFQFKYINQYMYE